MQSFPAQAMTSLYFVFYSLEGSNEGLDSTSFMKLPPWQQMLGLVAVLTAAMFYLEAFCVSVY